MPQLTRTPPTRQEITRDVWLAGAVLVGGLLSSVLISISGMLGTKFDQLPWVALSAVLVSIPLAFRRVAPIPVMLIIGVLFIVPSELHASEFYSSNVAMFLSLYTVGAWVNNRRAAFWSRVVLIAVMFGWLLSGMLRAGTGADFDPAGVGDRTGAFSPFLAYAMIQFLINIAFFGGAYYLGNRFFYAALDRAALIERQAELEHERELTAAQAVALDRVAIARELHDVVAHHVSAMGVQSGAARAVLRTSPDAAETMLRGVEDSARSAITELHQLLETLRAPGGAGADAPSTLRLTHIPDLVSRATQVGMPSTFTLVGEPRDVPDIAQVNLYRIAQEALTNARRHGGPHSSADVRLRFDRSAVELEIANTGRVALDARRGLGQLGMRERAAASGGTIEIGPRPRGGFLVRVRIPLTVETTLEGTPA